jgi:proton-dependent oligopeptide transporter, POT family
MMPSQCLDRKNIFPIAYTVFWDRFNLYGLQSFLILYLMTSFECRHSLHGTYTALSFALTVLGGITADRLLGFYHSVILGGILIIFANLILILPHIETTYIGLALMTVGIGFLVPNDSNLLGATQQKDSSKQTRELSILYLGISLGSITGPLMYGLAYAKLYWLGFALSAIGILTTILNLRKFKNSFSVPTGKYPLLKILVIIGLSSLASLFFIYHNEMFGYFITIAIIISVSFIISFSKKMIKSERLAVLLLLSPILSNVFFFTAFLQIFSSITIFIERNIDRSLFFGWQIPSSWFSSLEPFCIIFLVPTLNIFWKFMKKCGINVPPHKKIILGIFLCSTAFLIFSVTTQMIWINNYLLFLLLFIANLLLATGELCIVPVTISLISTVSPPNYKGTLMGIFYFSLTFSGYLSSLIAKTFPISSTNSAIDSMHLFLSISALLFIVAILLTLLNGFTYKANGESIIAEV